MNILFLGPSGGTSRHRVEAMRRLGHHVLAINPESVVPKQSLLAKLHYETGGLLCENAVTKSVLKTIGSEKFDLTWVDSGRYVGPRLIDALRSRSGPIINFNNDDPFGTRDRYSWQLFRKAVPRYDMLIVRRVENVAEAKARGAKSVKLIFLTADEVAHAPRTLSPEDHAKWDSDVSFVGTWFPERGPFMVELLERGVPLAIYGGRWQKAPEWPALEKAWRGPATKTDDEYALAIQCAKVCLGLLSKGNRDLHTRRSIEVPYLGSVLCAERTTEHQALYCEGKEAVFWADAAECAAACHALLNDDKKREEIARAGRLRCIENGHLNRPMLTEIFADLGLSTN